MILKFKKMKIKMMKMYVLNYFKYGSDNEDQDELEEN